MDSMTNMFPVTVTKLRDPVTKAIKNISTVLYELPGLVLSSGREQDVEPLVDSLQEMLENRSADWLPNDPEGKTKDGGEP